MPNERFEIVHEGITYRHHHGPWYVSACGRVRSVDHWVIAKTPWGFFSPRLKKGTALKANLSTRGYWKILLGCKGEHLVHRLVAQVWLENPGNLKEVNHIDYDTTNCHVSNLEWVDRQGNIDHSFARLRRGDNHPHRKASEKMVREIRLSKLEGASNKELSNRFGLHRSTVEKILNGKLWGHIV